MFKKITLSLMLSAFCTHQSLAGTGLSTPLKQEPENQKKTARKTAPNHNRDEGEREILAGLAALTIGGVATAYLLHQAYKEPESKPKTSSDSKGSLLPNVSIKEVKRPNQEQPRDTFHYQNENFYAEAWKKEHGLENNFPSSNKAFEIKEYSHSNMVSPFADSGENSDSLEEVLHSYNGFPSIDLRSYEESELLEGAARIDLHPVYNKNPRKHLRNEIFKRQIAYGRSETKDNKLYIITGTGKKRAGPDFRLQNAVDGWLQEDYCSSRISKYQLEQEGFFVVFLRKNKK
jgi:hypothetical protein